MDCIGVTIYILVMMYTISPRVSCFYPTITVPPENIPLREITTNDDGDIYIGGQNILLHLSKDLRHISNVTLGPVEDSKMCKPKYNACSSRKLSDNLVDVLLWLQHYGKLLVCGTVNQGLCELRDIQNISSVEDSCPKHNKKQYSLIGAETGALVHPYQVNKSLHFLVTHQWDGRDQQYFTDEFVLMKIADLTDHLHRQCWDFSKVTAFSTKSFHNDFRQNDSMKFVYSFDSEEFGSYVYNIYTRGGKTRIVRICKHDKYMFSLSEFTLSCGGYNIATSAFFDKHERNLYVAFGIGSHETTHEPTDKLKANICNFTLQNFHNKFQYITNRCYTYGDGYSPPRWATNNTKACTRKYDVSLTRFCGTDTNPGIDSDYVYSVKSLFKWNDGIITTIFHHRNEANLGREDILYIGTIKGHLLKVDLSRSTHYANYDLSRNESVRVEPKFVFDVPKENVYLITGNKFRRPDNKANEYLRGLTVLRQRHQQYKNIYTSVIISKFPLHSCRVHTTCKSCVTSDDPLGCGWCKDICLQKGECSGNKTWHEHSCPPFVYKIDPASGPQDGNTSLTIMGENFGSIKDKVSVSLHNISCAVTNVTDKKLVCLTSPTNITEKLPVIVNVTWQRTPTLNVSGISEIYLYNYSYKVPNITSFFPAKIPKRGNVTVTIEGDNLDIGGNRKVWIVGHSCKILSASYSNITCKTSHWYKLRGNIKNTESCIASKEVEVQIDGSTMYSDQEICLTHNPTILDISPMKTIMSGGVDVAIRGENLDSVSTIKFLVKFENQTICMDKDCKIVNATFVQCTMADVSTNTNIDIGEMLRSSLTLLMDDDVYFWKHSAAYTNQEFIVYPDPVFNIFDSNDETEIDYETKLLELKGQNLNYVFGKDNMSITVETMPCPIERMESTSLFCNLHIVFGNMSTQTFEVQVKAGNFKQNLGRIKFHKTHRYDELNDAFKKRHLVTVIAVTTVVLFFIVVILICMYINHVGPFRRKAKRFEPQVSYHSDNGRGSPGPEALSSLLQQRIENEHTSTNEYMRAPYDDKEGAVGYEDESSHVASTIDLLSKQNLLIDSDNLRLGSNIGRGNFGCVYEGYWMKRGERGEIEEQLVAVKTILRADNSDVKSFLDEALIMKDFNHPNVMSLIGISLPEGEFPVVVLPFMKNGDLLSYIRNDENAPTVRNLVNFGLDIAKGMEYLASIKFIHRDLAARNCMMDSDFTVKVADFGLSRDIYSKEYYTSDNKKKLPVKWMAPESIEKGTYTVKSDVWSFGVVLWELMTRGASPYGEVDNWDMTRYIRDGRRLPRPEFCPIPLYKMMLQCWEYHATERPTFTQIIEEIENLVLTKDKAYVVSDTRVDLQKCTNYHYTDQRTLQPQLSVQSTVSESAALLPQTE